jgi:hypothetical protein
LCAALDDGVDLLRPEADQMADAHAAQLSALG